MSDIRPIDICGLFNKSPKLVLAKECINNFRCHECPERQIKYKVGLVL